MSETLSGQQLWRECDRAADERTREVVAFLRAHAPYYADLVQVEFLTPATGNDTEWVDDGERGRTR